MRPQTLSYTLEWSSEWLSHIRFVMIATDIRLGVARLRWRLRENVLSGRLKKQLSIEHVIQHGAFGWQQFDVLIRRPLWFMNNQKIEEKRPWTSDVIIIITIIIFIIPPQTCAHRVHIERNLNIYGPSRTIIYRRGNRPTGHAF